MIRRVLLFSIFLNNFLISCSVSRRDENIQLEKKNTKINSSGVERGEKLNNFLENFDYNDFDGDNISNDVDINPYFSDIPSLNFVVSQDLDIKLNSNGVSKREFVLERFSDPVENLFLEKIRFDLGRDMARSFKAQDLIKSRSVYSDNSTLIITPFSNIDSILNLKKLTREGFYGFHDKTGEVLISGEIKSSGKFFKIFNIKYSIGFSDQSLEYFWPSRLTALKDGEVDIELSQIRDISNFTIFQSMISQSDLYNCFLKEAGYIFLKIEDFDYTLKESGTVYNYRTVKEKIVKSTLSLNIVLPDQIITKNIHLDKLMSLEEVLKKNFEDHGEVKVDQSTLLSFYGYESSLKTASDLISTKEDTEGRWFVTSSITSNSPRAKLSNGDSVTLAYLRGEDIYKASRKLERYSFTNFTGRIGSPTLPLLKNGDRISIVLEGVSKDDFTLVDQNFGEIGGLPQRVYNLYGKLAHIKRQHFYFDGPEDPRIKFDVTVGLKSENFGSFHKVNFMKDLNSIVLSSDYLSIKKPIFFSIDSRNKTENFSTNLVFQVVTRVSGPNNFPVNIQSQAYYLEDFYNVDVLVESSL